MRHLAVTFVALAALSASSARAEGLVNRLPADGTWAKFHVQMKSTAPAAEMDVTGEFWIKSVGAETVNGKKCRWLEFEFEAEVMGRQQNAVFKLLVPEENFKKGKNPIEEIVRGWRKNDENAAKEITDDERTGARRSELALFLGGKLAERETLKEAVTVEYQKGKLTCKTGIRGKLELKNPMAPVAASQLITLSIWPHKKAPFGTAKSLVKMVIKSKEAVIARMQMTFTLADSGKDAKSSLPDNN